MTLLLCCQGMNDTVTVCCQGVNDSVTVCCQGVNDTVTVCCQGVNDTVTVCCQEMNDIVTVCCQEVNVTVTVCSQGVNDTVAVCSQGVNDTVTVCSQGVKLRTRFGEPDRGTGDSQDSLETKQRGSSKRPGFMPTRSIASATRLINQHLFGIQTLEGMHARCILLSGRWIRHLITVLLGHLTSLLQLTGYMHTISPRKEGEHRKWVKSSDGHY
jgi:hypothetical protein